MSTQFVDNIWLETITFWKCGTLFAAPSKFFDC